MAKFKPYSVSKAKYDEAPVGVESSYVCSIPDWDRRGVHHKLVASAFLDTEGDVDEYRFVVDYFEWAPDARVINMPLYGLNVQKITDEVAVVFKATDFTVHPRMTTTTADMLNEARKRMMVALRVKKTFS